MLNFLEWLRTVGHIHCLVTVHTNFNDFQEYWTKIQNGHCSEESVGQHMEPPAFKPNSRNWNTIPVHLNEDSNTVEKNLDANTNGDSQKRTLYNCPRCNLNVCY